MAEEGNGQDQSPAGRNGEPPEGIGESPEPESDPSHEARLAHFITMLSDDDESRRWKAAEALGRMEDPAAVDELIGTLWDDDARVRIKAAWALGQIGDRRAYAPLQRLYRMENEDVREVIEGALENIRRSMSPG